jgi:hypothetical protein
MSIQDVRLFSLAGPARVIFADPDWRGDFELDGPEGRLRPLSDIRGQIAKLSAWIAAGEAYGWLGDYQARRARFELQSIRAAFARETARTAERIGDRERLGVQSRLDRLQACLDAARPRGAS